MQKLSLYGPERKGTGQILFLSYMDGGHRDILGVDKTGHLLFCTEESVKSSWAIHTKLYNIYRGNTFPTHIMSDSVITPIKRLSA